MFVEIFNIFNCAIICFGDLYIVRNSVSFFIVCVKMIHHFNVNQIVTNKRNRSESGMSGMALKWVRMAPNGTNPELFQIRGKPICTEI